MYSNCKTRQNIKCNKGSSVWDIKAIGSLSNPCLL